MSTEVVKKTKAAAKPRKAEKTPKAKIVPTTKIVMPTHEEIAALAEKYWAERGRQDGAAEQDWLRAEQELLKLAS